MLLQRVLYMALSITELFKYNTNGNHLIMTDMKLFRSVKSLTSFAYIKITPRLIIFVGIVLAYIVVSFWFNPKFSLHTKRLRRMITGLSCLLACALVISSTNPVHTGLRFFPVWMFPRQIIPLF